MAIWHSGHRCQYGVQPVHCQAWTEERTVEWTGKDGVTWTLGWPQPRRSSSSSRSSCSRSRRCAMASTHGPASANATSDHGLWADDDSSAGERPRSPTGVVSCPGDAMRRRIVIGPSGRPATKGSRRSVLTGPVFDAHKVCITGAIQAEIGAGSGGERRQRPSTRPVDGPSMPDVHQASTRQQILVRCHARGASVTHRPHRRARHATSALTNAHPVSI